MLKEEFAALDQDPEIKSKLSYALGIDYSGNFFVKDGLLFVNFKGDGQKEDFLTETLFWRD